MKFNSPLFIVLLLLFLSGCGTDSTTEPGADSTTEPDSGSGTDPEPGTGSGTDPGGDVKNNEPTISGEPEKATVNQLFKFKPVSTDLDGDELSYSIENKPGWIKFNESTGELSGRPTLKDVGKYAGVKLIVSDTKSEASLVFNLEVVKLVVQGDPVEQALTTGDASYVSESMVFVNAALKIINATGGTELTGDIEPIKVMLSHLQSGSYSFTLTNSKLDFGGNNDPRYKKEFKAGAESVQKMMRRLDESKRNIFREQGLKLEKLLVLLGDHYRQKVKYPMHKETTDIMVFLHALYADFSVYNFRELNLAQPDLGNFSRSDFSHITPTTKTINLQSKPDFRAAGVYALPGQTVRITRLDNSNATPTVYMSSVRSFTTHVWSERVKYLSYNRPKFVKTHPVPINKGETISITSPYGGPIQIGFDTNGQAVSLKFENIGEHAFWNGAEDTLDFNQKLAANDFDWAELVTPNFEVHSKVKKMKESLRHEVFFGPEQLAKGAETYIHNYAHILAGYKGPGIDVEPEIHGFAKRKGFEIELLDKVKHMNADQQGCGSGCSGNPYDTTWKFNPVYHGDLHEFGHGLEKGRFKIDKTWNVHSTTNFYAYYSKSRYKKNTGNRHECFSKPFEELFNALQRAAKTNKPEEEIKKNRLFKEWNYGTTIYIQMMMIAQAENKLQNGWFLLPRLHIVEREYRKAAANKNSWLARRDSLGFGHYSFKEAELGGWWEKPGKFFAHSDWVAIALGTATELDFSDYMKMWGHPVSARAASQLASNGYKKVERKMVVSQGNDYCDGFEGKRTVPVDGRSSWPR